MAFRHGSKAELTVNSTALSTFCDDISMDMENDSAETTTFTKTWKTNIPGVNGAEVKVSGNYDPTATTGPLAVLEPLLGAAAFPVVYYPGGNLTGQRSRTFNAILGTLGDSSQVGDKVTFEFTLIVDGAVTFAVV